MHNNTGNHKLNSSGNTIFNSPGKQSGLSMIEVLVTLLILMVGLLGLAGLQTQGLRSEMESYQRVQALILLQDMVGRINANRVNAADYVASDIGTKGDGQPTVCTALAGQPRDRCEWSNALKGAAETSVTATGVAMIGAMIGGRGCVTLISAVDQTYLVSVAWQGLGKTLAQTTNECGKDQYGDDDAQRRVVSLTLRIANLS